MIGVKLHIETKSLTVDKEVKFPPFCTLCLKRNVCISHIPKQAQLSCRSGLDTCNKGPKGSRT